MEEDLLVGFVSHGLGVAEAAGHHAREDKVEWFLPRPVLFKVVDLEGTVRRHTD